jgi:oligopeptide/dipeptide ABC transporter ATP-binding protein
MSSAVLLKAQGLSKFYDDRSHGLLNPRRIEAVSDLSFELPAGGSLGIVGESGSGKTTTARMIVGLEPPTSGSLHFEGQLLSTRPSVGERRLRAHQIQIVFQNPFTSLDPKQTALASIGEVVRFHTGVDRHASQEVARRLLESVGLGAKEALSRPRQLSGGQAQRVGIARALAAEPRLLVLDEAVSALDVSVQAQILNLLADLRQSLGVGYVFISHDLAVVRQVCDSVLVMYRGRAVEYGAVEAILSAPLHPYAQKLLASVPGPNVDWGPSVATDDPETGCRFRHRCPRVFAKCAEEPPITRASGHDTRCWLVGSDSPLL